jgi:hypothetical protein
MTPDRETVRAYISALAGSPDAEMTWQLLMDDRSAKRYAFDYHLPLTDKLWAEFVFQNSRGVGIFAMVNVGNGNGRCSANVTALRALFVDDDAGVLPPESDRLAPLAPSLSVRSKRGFHHYWCLLPGEPLEAFAPAQATLAAHFGTDSAVKDLPRVMRVPGFFHMKNPTEPRLVELERTSDARYTIAQVLAAYPLPHGAPVPCPTPNLAASSNRKPGLHLAKGDVAAVLEALQNLPIIRWAVEHPEDVSREAWRGIATNIAAAVLEHDESYSAAAALFHDISRHDSDRYSEAECDRAFRDAVKSAREFGPMTFRTLGSAGVPLEICERGAIVAKAPVGAARSLARTSLAR